MMNIGSHAEGTGPSSNGPIGSTNTTSTIPSLKRTLSGGAAASLQSVHRSNHLSSHPVQGSTHSQGSHLRSQNTHLGAGMNTIPSVLHVNSSTGPPQVIRAVTSSGAYNRPQNTLQNQSFRGQFTTMNSSNSIANGSTGVSSMVTRSSSQSAIQDWRMYLTIEERQAVRAKIRDAYMSKCTTFEDLLHVACAIEEELLHISAPSRLDYFKSGFEFENRVKLKKDQLQGQVNASLDTKRRTTINSSTDSSTSNSNANNSGNTKSPSPKSSKKQRT